MSRTPHQFYVTHCTKADSLTGTAGFSVRAASTADPALVRGAFALPAYELPMDLWAKRPTRAHAPRRLARLRGADGLTWVMHTAYLEKDTTNRDRCYFTHALAGLSHTPAEVLRAWGDGWATEYPPGAGKTLRPPARLDPAGRIDDDAVSRFLTGHADDEPLSLRVAPPRLVADPAGCRALVKHFLAAVLAAATDRASGRTRVFVHAEPGVVALLVYAAARLLPDAVGDDLTFTTFEPAHRNPHEFESATVVGTYTGNPAKGLDEDLLADRGYALDTFAHTPLPPELAAHAARIAPLVQLAADDRWATLDALHAVAGSGVGWLDRLPHLLPLAAAVERVDANCPTPEDLLALWADPGGRAALATRRRAVWPHVRHHALTDADIGRTFAPWINEPDSVADFLREVADHLRGHDLPAARSHWGVLARTDPAKAGERLVALLRRLDDAVTELPVYARQWLRTRCVAHPPTDPQVLKPLLVPVDAADGEAIVGEPNLPPTWKAYSLSVMTTRPADGDTAAAVRHLAAAPPAVLASYLHRAIAEGDDGRPLFEALTAANPDPTSLVRKLLDAGTVKPKWWAGLVDHLLQSGEPVAERLADGGVLGPLLAVVGNTRPYHPLWATAAGRLDGRFIDGDDSQAAEWDAVEHALAAAPPLHADDADELPAEVRDKLTAGAVLRRAFADRTFDLSGRTEQLHAACRAFWYDPFDTLVRVYRGRYLWADPDADPLAFHPLPRLFDAFFPFDPLAYESVCGALARWCELSEHAPDDARREAVQRYYVRTFLVPVVLPDVLADVLADDTRVFLAPRARAALTRPTR